MHIELLELYTVNLAGQAAFYREDLGLYVYEQADRITVSVGASQLRFLQAPDGWRGRYHFAFNIPPTRLEAAKAWLLDAGDEEGEFRTVLPLQQDGADTFYFADWNARAVYFYDAGGNIAELIARHDLPDNPAQPADAPFTHRQILNISEIGLATDAVPALAAHLADTAGLPRFGSGGDAFAALGDHDGLFILVQTGRVWFPTQSVLAQPLFVRAVVRVGEKRFTLHSEGNTLLPRLSSAP